MEKVTHQLRSTGIDDKCDAICANGTYLAAVKKGDLINLQDTEFLSKYRLFEVTRVHGQHVLGIKWISTKIIN